MRSIVTSAKEAEGGLIMATPTTAKTRAEKNEYALRSGPMPAPYVPRRGYADGPYGQVHFRDTGSGMPLVLCHQAPQTSRQFTNVYQPLHRRGIRAIGVDTPGFGESDPTPFVPTVEDWAAAIPAALDHLGLAQADVLGHHTGGMVATEVALQFPERVRRLIINGPLPMSVEERVKFLEYVQEQEIGFVYAADGSHLQASFAVRNGMYGPRLCKKWPHFPLLSDLGDHSSFFVLSEPEFAVGTIFLSSLLGLGLVVDTDSHAASKVKTAHSGRLKLFQDLFGTENVDRAPEIVSEHL